ncbi:MAG TPA: ATP synthase F0 subunit C [Fimbriimonadales bacterium]|nr:ATP synthase F0 subunit C [Fimbriimonadales bacterium]
MIAIAAMALAIGTAMGFAVLGAAIGQGHAANGALNGVARQPEMAGRIQMLLLLSLAFIESLVLFTFFLAFQLLGKLPNAAEVDMTKVSAYEQRQDSNLYATENQDPENR